MSFEVSLALSALVVEAMSPPIGYIVRVDCMAVGPSKAIHVSIRRANKTRYIYRGDIPIDASKTEAAVLDMLREARQQIAALAVCEAAS